MAIRLQPLAHGRFHLHPDRDGLYIADPFTVSRGRRWINSSWGMCASGTSCSGWSSAFLFLWRIYLAFFSRFHADWKDFLAWTELEEFDPADAILPSRFEGTARSTPTSTVRSSRWPIWGLLVMVFLIVLTGLILMGAGYDAGLTALVYKLVKPFENWMGGLAMVRWIHHILMWGFILFIAVHIYMAFWYDVVFKEGTVSSMISGMVFRRSHQ